MTECCIPHTAVHLPDGAWAALQPGDEIEVTVFAGKAATFAILGPGDWAGRPSLQLRPISPEPDGSHMLVRAECGRVSYWWMASTQGYGGSLDTFRRLSGQMPLALASPLGATDTTTGGQA